jgi:hypothetical protein
MQIRDMTANDVEAVARLWWLSWHGAHADILPVEVVHQPMLECFAARARAACRLNPCRTVRRRRPGLLYRTRKSGLSAIHCPGILETGPRELFAVRCRSGASKTVVQGGLAGLR